jgi:Sugar (and other) transporter
MIFSALTVMLVQVTPIALAKISWKFFLIFLVCNCIYVTIFYFVAPETRLKTLEEIEAIFGDKVSLLAIKGSRVRNFMTNTVLGC